MTKFIFKSTHKGWFKNFGLHHVVLSSAFIAMFHALGIGFIGAGIAIGWYGQREYGPQVMPPATFEFWDFVSPTIISLGYILLWRLA